MKRAKAAQQYWRKPSFLILVNTKGLDAWRLLAPIVDEDDNGRIVAGIEMFVAIAIVVDLDGSFDH